MDDTWKRFMDHHRVVTLGDTIDRYNKETILGLLSSTTVIAHHHFKKNDYAVLVKP